MNIVCHIITGDLGTRQIYWLMAHQIVRYPDSIPLSRCASCAGSSSNTSKRSFSTYHLPRTPRCTPGLSCEAELGNLSHLVLRFRSNLVRNPPPQFDGLHLAVLVPSMPYFHKLGHTSALLGSQLSPSLRPEAKFVTLVN
ncbi:hypothetical protein CaCOL14_002301 [Colletotrichum acutatum]